MFTNNLKKILCILSLFLNIFILGCTINKSSEHYSTASDKSNIEQTNSDNSDKLKIEKIQGKLIYEKNPPGKSVRAYKGEEFFLINNTLNQTKLVLRPSEKISDSQLKSFHNQDVKITAVYKKGNRPDVSKVSCPLDIDRQCMIQGQGYEVLSIVTN